jgi:release factor glutamine methyltransferase
MYSPREDTLLLADEASNLNVDRVLEIGIGSGLVIQVLARSNNHIVGTEIDQSVIRKVKQSIRQKTGACKTDLLVCDGASAFRSGVFDVILFNPPYLPADQIVDKTVDGGEKGVKVSERWLKDATRIIKETGQIIFVLSNLSDCITLLGKMLSEGFHSRIVRIHHLFFEDLLVIRTTKKP